MNKVSEYVLNNPPGKKPRPDLRGDELFGRADDISSLILKRRFRAGVPTDNLTKAIIRDTVRETIQECVNLVRGVGELS